MTGFGLFRGRWRLTVGQLNHIVSVHSDHATVGTREIPAEPLRSMHYFAVAGQLRTTE